MTGRPTTPGWHCHRCRSTSCRQRADSDTQTMWDASSIDLYCLPSLRVYPGSGPTPTGVHLKGPQEVLRVQGSGGVNPLGFSRALLREGRGTYSDHIVRTRGERRGLATGAALGSVAGEGWLPGLAGAVAVGVAGPQSASLSSSLSESWLPPVAPCPLVLLSLPSALLSSSRVTVDWAGTWPGG